MHQEILGNQPLVVSVCDKAKQLVDQTKDTSLNIYLNSLKELVDNIVLKSKVCGKNYDLYIIYNYIITQYYVKSYYYYY